MLTDTASALPCSTWLLITFLFQHQLCIGEIFQGLDVLKNQTVRGGTVETLFQNLSLIKKYIDRQKERCGEERRRTRQFLDYLQEFLGVMSTEWTMED
ncbi:Il5 [Lemmus lemmus]